MWLEHQKDRGLILSFIALGMILPGLFIESPNRGAWLNEGLELLSNLRTSNRIEDINSNSGRIEQ